MVDIKCPICDTVYRGHEGEKYDYCPKCNWAYTGIEDTLEENEKDSYNCMSLKEAKAMLARGLTIFGAPLPERPKTK